MSNIYTKYFDNKLDNVVKFKFYIDGIEEDKIKEFEDLERKYYENTSDNYESVEFDFFDEYWKDWWTYNSNYFFDYMKKQHNIFKTNESITCMGFEINKIIKNSKDYQIIYDYEVAGTTRIVINFIIQRMNDEENKSSKENNYDIDLENIKMDIKNFWIKILEERKNQIGQEIVRYKCIWIEDMQSLYLSNKAYGEINIIENVLRNFINRIMLNKCGLNWQEIFLKSKVKDKYEDRTNGYKEVVKNFNNIDDFLLSIDAIDLANIMDYEEEIVEIRDIKNEVDQLSECIKKDKNKMFCNVKKIEMLFENIVKKNKRKSQSIWEIHFSDLFDIEDKYIDGKSDLLFKSNFRERWRELCKYRNHIAHNKFIDSIFYRDLEKLINELKCKIDEAEKEFSLLIENEKIHSSWDDPVCVSKKDRERVIHQQVVDLACDLVKEFKYKDIDAEKGFRYYANRGKEFEDEFKVFLNKTRNSIGAIKIIEVETDKKIRLQLTRKKGELCSYIVEFLVNEECIERTEIAHDGYGFCCDGYNEINGSDDNSEYYRNVIGQSWDYWRDYERNITNSLKDILNKNCR